MNDKQVPIGSGFGPHTTADEVLAGLDLSGKRAIVTGGHSGLGLETTRALADSKRQGDHRRKEHRGGAQRGRRYRWRRD